jgi:NAD(P) transhydrogenase subunit alpha
MKIAVMRERTEAETRVAATPETVGKLVALGASVSIETGAGFGARMPDAEFKAAGASIAATAAAAVKGADVILTVRRPAASALRGAAKGALLIGTLDPYGNEKDVAALAKTGVTAISMEFLPRITRAQVMDVLSSQANLAGYQSVIDAAGAFDRAFPMMMTAAGTIRPAKVFVMGAGVAGLQAIATAKRLGAVVTANDVRPAAKEQVQSLGGKFVAVEDDEFKQAETAGGYAKEMSAAYKEKQAALTASHIAKQDIVITTALIPGRPAPRLVSKAMVESMAPGSIIVDLAAERGGNVELTKPGEVYLHHGVTIIGYRNVPGRVATSASQLYARNLLAFLDTLIDKKAKALAINWDDELVKATVLTRDGAVVHPNFISKTADVAAHGRVRPTAAEKAARTKKQKVAIPAMALTPKPPEGVEVAPVAAPAKTPAKKKPAARKPASKSVATKPAAAKSAAVAKSAPAKSAPAKPARTKKPAAKKPAAPKGTK